MESGASYKNTRLIAIDPGSAKLGYAVLDSTGEVLDKGIIRDQSKFEAELAALTRLHKPEKFLIGNGTSSGKIKKMLAEVSDGKVTINEVDEKSSTEQARKEYFASFPPIVRFFLNIKYILGIVSLEVDDDVAVILAKRFLGSS